MPLKELEFIQINLKKAFSAAVELNSSLKETKEYVALLTEPYIYNGKVASAPPESTVLSEGAEPRAAIIANKSVRITKIDQLSNRDCIVGIIKTEKERIIIASIYMDIKKK